MKIEALLRAAQILRSQPTYAMPLTRLHAYLAEELGADAGTYRDIYLALKKRPQSFMVLDAPQLLTDAAGETDLESNLGACVRVSLTEVAPGDQPTDALGMAAATVSELWQHGNADAVLHDCLSRAADQLEQIGALIANADAAERPTTHFRDPHRRSESPPPPKPPPSRRPPAREYRRG